MVAMAVSEAYKKRKRSSKYFGLHTFLDPGCPISPSGPFRENIRQFLRECAEIEDYNVEGMPVWCTLLVHENRGIVLPLYTIEENVKHSFQPLCDHCRCAGWSHHFVSKRKYHLIIPIDSGWNKPLNEGVLDMETHLLHGLIHCNGFGHLLCINGIEGGSKFICGKEIMNLWDRICTNLHARKITVVDMTKKKEMYLRLLYGVAYGHSWFGRWGYTFCHGSFGVTKYKYERALEVLHSLELDRVNRDFQNRDVKKILSRYREMSETSLFTLGELLRFMLISVKSQVVSHQKKMVTAVPNTRVLQSPPPARPFRSVRIPSQNKEKLVKVKKFSTLAAKLDSRWPVRRLEFVAAVVVDALAEKKAKNGHENCGMSRQEARDAARLHIGDTGLIDYVLKSMNNVVVGSYIVRRAVNHSTRVIEYSIQEVKNRVELETETCPTQTEKEVEKYDPLPGNEVYSDLVFVYNMLLLDYPESETVEHAVKTILDSKHFVKIWPFKDDDDELLRFICRVRNLADLGAGFTREFSHGEYIVLPLHATVGDLRTAVENAMRDTYCVMEDLVIAKIDGMGDLDENEVIFGQVESGSEISVSGSALHVEPEDLKYEGGEDNWTVKCRCGARDDDGERMVACDICEVWQHTRCSGIDDAEEVPSLFVCYQCCSSLAQGRSMQMTDVDYADWMMQGFDYNPILC